MRIYFNLIWAVHHLAYQLFAEVCDSDIESLISRGYIYDGHPFWSSKTKNIMECAVVCLKRKNCESFNFDTVSRTCDLLADTGSPTTPVIGRVHSRISSWPSQIDPGCFDRPCGVDEVCLSVGLPGPVQGGTPCQYSCFKKTIPIKGSNCESDDTCDGMNGVCLTNKKCGCDAGMYFDYGEKRCLKECEDGWHTFGDSCYLFSTHQLMFTPASAFCNSKSGHLVQIDTTEELSFIKGILNSQPFTYQQIGYWTDMYQFENDHFERWKTSNKSVTVLDWGGSEPNNPAERCTIFDFGRAWTWSDYYCENPSYLIRPLCEKPTGRHRHTE